MARNLEDLKNSIECKYYDYVIGIDPGMKTYLAGVRRNIDTGVEVNFKIASKQYHWDAKQGIRDKKAKRMTATFNRMEKTDRKNRQIYVEIPSPRGIGWRDYD